MFEYWNNNEYSPPSRKLIVYSDAIIYEYLPKNKQLFGIKLAIAGPFSNCVKLLLLLLLFIIHLFTYTSTSAVFQKETFLQTLEK